MVKKRIWWEDLPEEVLEVFNKYYSKAYFTKEEWSEMERAMEGVEIIIDMDTENQGD